MCAPKTLKRTLLLMSSHTTVLAIVYLTKLVQTFLFEVLTVKKKG